ncbi:MAG TPA: hypothetical protein VMK42_03565 [Anaeromyxobacteraceae bacterium]|nr:hypothetical protein [Anaeromyxobacteraceae bacterium]
MQRNGSGALFLAVACLFAVPARGAELSVDGYAGYQNGFGLRALGTVGNLLHNLPIGFDLGVGITWVSAGDPYLARAVFVNDATNGTPQTSASVWDLRMDVIWFFHLSGTEQTGVFLGPRLSLYSGDFHYVGGNEDFTVTSNNWGVGAGVRGAIPLSKHWGLAVTAGLDWYPVITFYGHDTTYSSNGYSVNPKANYTFSSAYAAINQAFLVPSILVGVSWNQ